MKIKAGQIVMISTGEYSDYGVRDHMRAGRDFDSIAEAQRFVATGNYLAAPDYAPNAEPDTYQSDDRFLAWCIREGLLSPLDEHIAYMHIGAYGELNLHERSDR